MDNSRVGGSSSMPVDKAEVFDSTMKPTVAAEEFASEIRPFGEALESEQKNIDRKQGYTEREQGRVGESQTSGYSKDLGGSAVASEGLFAAPPAPNVQGLEADSQGVKNMVYAPENSGQGAGNNLMNQGIEDSGQEVESGFANQALEFGNQATGFGNQTTGDNNQAIENSPIGRFKSLASDGSTEKKFKKLFAIFDGDTISKNLKTKIDGEINKHENNPFELDNVRNQEMAEFLRSEYGRIFADDGNEVVGYGNIENGNGKIGNDRGEGATLSGGLRNERAA